MIFSRTLQNKKPNYLYYVASISIIFWLLLIASSFFIKDGTVRISILAARIEFGVQFITLSLLAYLFFILNKKDRKPIIWLVAINFWLFFVDLFFYIAAYANHTYLLKMSIIQFALYYSPCIIYCIIMIVFLTKILLKEVLQLSRFLRILGALIAVNVVTVILFSSSIQYAFGVISWQSISQMILLGAELILFDFAILGLIYANNSSIFLLLSGTIILIVGDFFLTYSSISQTVALFSYGELFWLLGLLFIMFAMISIIQNHHYSIKTWFRTGNMIKSHLAMWSVIMSITGFLIFFVIAYVFSIVSKQIFVGLPLFIMLYSIIAVTFSIFIGKNFEAPFNILTKNIQIFMNEHDKTKLDKSFSIEEFVFLNQFVINAIEAVEEKETAKKKLGEVTAQIAHDIRSPLTTIEVLIKQINNSLPESERLMLRNAVRRINDIAYQLVQKYKGRVAQEGNENLIFLYLSVLEIVSEKRFEYSNKKINIEVIVKDNKSFFAMTRGNITEWKRVLSNLINNSVNALTNGGNIEISLAFSSGDCVIKIVDNGCGIAADHLKQLQSENLEVGDKVGLGLSHARKYLKTMNGMLEIESVLGKGTEVIIKMPLCDKPEWLCNEIMFREDCILVVVDDDPSIHDAWRQKIRQEIEEKHHKINMIHLNSPEECLAWLETYPDNNIVLFSDYEYLNSEMNGLQLLKSISKPIMHKKLVTSHYENEQIINDLTDGIKLLPKQLVHAIQFNLLPAVTEDQYDLIFIDDQEDNRKMWENFAKRKDIKIKTYPSTAEFQIDKINIAFTTPIYVDQDLGEGKETGLEFTRKLYDEGFQNLYLATSYVLLDTDHQWLKGVTSKKPPFI